MNMILSFLTFLEVVAATLIIVVVLMQRSKSGGGLGALSGGATEEVFGSSAGNVLSRTTVILSLFFLVNTLIIVALQGNITKGKNVSVVDSVDNTEVKIAEPTKEEGVEPSAPVIDNQEVTGTPEEAKTTDELSTDQPKSPAAAAEDSVETKQADNIDTKTETENKPAESPDQPSKEKPNPEEEKSPDIPQ